MPMAKDFQELIVANHILHFHNVVDAYGHISLRHPEKLDVFIMSADKAPALVSSISDFVFYNVADGSPVESSSKLGYQERFIHSELYKRFPEVNSVVHSHSESVLPYTMNGVPMQAAFHIAGFLGTHVPIHDLSPLYRTNDTQNLLVNTVLFGASLASSFSSSKSATLDHKVVLMANHGFTTVGNSIKQAVFRAVYTHKNAKVQSDALMIRSAHQATSGGPSIRGGKLKYLSTEQAAGGLSLGEATQERPWELWVRQTEMASLYMNELKGVDLLAVI